MEEYESLKAILRCDDHSIPQAAIYWYFLRDIFWKRTMCLLNFTRTLIGSHTRSCCSYMPFFAPICKFSLAFPYHNLKVIVAHSRDEYRHAADKCIF